jgi:hypothetical protein
MKKLSTVVLLACMLLFAGCCGNASREGAFHDAMEQGLVASKLLDQYEKYLDDDKVIKDDTRKIRKGTASKIREVLAEEKRALKD